MIYDEGFAINVPGYEFLSFSLYLKGVKVISLYLRSDLLVAYAGARSKAGTPLSRKTR